MFMNSMKLFNSVRHCLRHFRFSTLHRKSLEDSTICLQLLSSNPCFHALALCSSLLSVHRIHSQLVVLGATENLLVSTKLVSLYGSFGEIAQARLVFDRIANPDLYSWKVMLRWYFLNDSYRDVLQLYKSMKQCLTEQDNVTFSVVLTACSELCDLAEGTKVHSQIVKVGNPDNFVVTGLLDMYAKCGMIECSRAVFDEIPEQTLASWTSMIASYVRNDCAEEGLHLFNAMRAVPFKPNEYTLGSLLMACGRLAALHQGKWIQGYVIKTGSYLDSGIGSALLDMYVKNSTIYDAHSLFYELYLTDLISWTTLIVGYTQRNYPYEALLLFTDKKWAHIIPSSITMASVISSCALLGSLKLSLPVHLLTIQLGLADDVAVCNALIDMYTKCGRVGDANYVFMRMPVKDVVTWNTMVSGYAQNGLWNESFLLFNHMRSGPVLPDAVTFVNVLSACSCFGGFQICTSFHAYVAKVGMLSNIYMGTALLNVYNKCGDTSSARKIFDTMCQKSMVTWAAMIGGYRLQGNSNNSLSLFNEMLNEKLQPNSVVLTNVLSTCSHSGMVEEGIRHFDGMYQAYQIVPTDKHYVCMVDLLARAGRLEDAVKFIEKMPIKADISLWGALLHGCGLHSRWDLGEVAIKRMLELNTDAAEYYVLISNFYASHGRWNQVSEIRKWMKARGLNKSPGYSFPEMDCAPLPVLEAVAMS